MSEVTEVSGYSYDGQFYGTLGEAVTTQFKDTFKHNVEESTYAGEFCYDDFLKRIEDSSGFRQLFREWFIVLEKDE